MPPSHKNKSISDEELIDRFLVSRDNSFMGELYERYGHLVLGLCIKYLKNTDEAKDMVIHIFTNLMSDLGKHKVQFFKSWLYVYSKNSCLMELRKKQRALKKDLEIQENAYLILDFSDPEHLNEKESQIKAMEMALEKLSTEQRTCIQLFYYENKSYREIVGITGFSNTEVKSHIQNGKRNLKIKMENSLNGE